MNEWVVLTLRADGVQPIERSTDLRHIDVEGPMSRGEAVVICGMRQSSGYLSLIRPLAPAWGESKGKTYDHEPMPDDMPEPGDRCKECGEAVTWMGPSQYDWMHVDDVRNR